MPIAGVKVTPLLRLPDDRGAVLHMMRSDREPFRKFGEVYFSMAYPGVVKGWHRHRRTTLNYAAVVGAAKVVCYDDRPDSPSQGEIDEFVIGEMNYALVTVPPLVWNGFMALGRREVMLANCADMVHDPEEIDRADPYGPLVAYRWGPVSR